MRATRQLHIHRLGALVLAGFCWQPISAAPETVALAGRPSVVIIPNDVTVDGRARPDIAQALADSFSAGLLKAGDYRVFQADIVAPRSKNKKREVMLGSSSTGNAGVPSDMDIKFTFNLVGQDDDYRFTVKKIRAGDGEVMEVHELETHGKLDKVFGLVPNVLMKMQARVKQKSAFPRTQSPAQVAGLAAPVAPRTVPDPAVSGNSTFWTTHASLPPEHASIDLSKVPKALIYQSVGSVQFIDEAWKFCVIRPRTDVKLRKSDGLHILYDEDGKIFADLRIANFDGGRVIADFGNRTPGYRKIFPGDEVFGWAPPVR